MPIGLGSGLWAAVVPMDAINMALNPSWEFGTTGASAIQGATLGSTSQFQRFGAWSLKVTPSSNGTSGALLGTWTSGIGTTYSVSIWAFVEQGVPMRAGVGDSSGLNLQTNGTITFTGGGTWQWYQIPGVTEVSNTTRSVVLQKASGISQLSYYVDGLMINPWTDGQDRTITYFDGDTGGGTWSGAQQASSSFRSGQYRGGGSIVALADLGLQVDQMIGVGMPPVDVSTQSYAITDGAQFQRQRAAQRTLTLTAKPINGTSLANFHAVRGTLIDLFKPDLVANQQPITLLYYGAGGTIGISAYYDKGLELGQMDGILAEDAAIGFIAADPYWYAPTQAGTTLAARTGLGSANFIAYRDGAGRWGTLGAAGTTVNAPAAGITPIQQMAWAPSGTLYAVGTFTTIGGTAASNLGWYTPANNQFGTILGALNLISSIAMLPNETFFIGGTYTGAGGTTGNNHVSIYNKAVSARTVGTLIGGTVDGYVRSLYYSPYGTLFVGGQFAQAAGTVTPLVATYDPAGLAWGTLTGGTVGGRANSDFVTTMAQGQSGTLYLGGRIGTVAGTVARSIVFWAGGAFGTVPQGLAAGGTIAYWLSIGSDQRVWVAGDFGSAGGQLANNAAVYNGVQLAPLSSGFPNGEMHVAKYMQNGNVLFGGTFAGTAGGVPMIDNAAIWTGANFIPLDIDFPGAANISDMLQLPNGTMYVAYRTSGTAQAASVATLVNTGKAEVYPILRMRNLGSTNARPYQLANTSTGAYIYFNLMMLGSETCTLALQPGARSFQSNIRGNLFGNIMASSNLAAFNLLPGTNTVSFFSDANIEASFYWQPRSWSLDGGTI